MKRLLYKRVLYWFNIGSFDGNGCGWRALWLLSWRGVPGDIAQTGKDQRAKRTEKWRQKNKTKQKQTQHIFWRFGHFKTLFWEKSGRTILREVGPEHRCLFGPWFTGTEELCSHFSGVDSPFDLRFLSLLVWGIQTPVSYVSDTSHKCIYRVISGSGKNIMCILVRHG